MANQQLVDYIKQQFGLGVSKDVIRGSLQGAGWAAADVDDAVKSAEAAPASAAPVQAPLAIKVSDLVSAADSNLEIVAPAAKEEKKNKEKEKEESKKEEKKKKEAVKAIEPAGAAGTAAAKAPKFKMPRFTGPLVAIVVLAVLAAGSAAAAAFFYMQKGNLGGKIASLSADREAANAKIISLNAQIKDLTQSNGDLNSRISSLSSDNQQLSGELSFFIVPAGASPSSEESFDIKGVLGVGGKNFYTVFAGDGLKVGVKNSKDAKVDAALKPFLGNSVEISGTHLAGSASVTVTSVNGASVQ